MTYDNPWYFNGMPFESEQIGDYFGFVYCITNLTNGRKYIGRKYFWSIRKIKKTDKRRTRTESDWKSYYGSSETVKQDVNVLGKENFKREILSLHKTKGSTNYTEIKEQFARNVIQDTTYYNDSINGKFHNIRLDEIEYSEIKTHTDEWSENHSKLISSLRKIHNHAGEEKFWPKECSVPEGWIPGGRPRGPNPSHSLRLKTAWANGAYSLRPKNKHHLTSEQRKLRSEKQLGVKNHRYGKKNTREHQAALTAATKGKIWVRNETENLRIEPSDLQKYLDQGWHRGKLNSGWKKKSNS